MRSSRRSQSVFPGVLLSLLLSSLAWLVGCSDSDRVAVHPVAGKLLIDGAAPEGAVIVFHPVTPPEKAVNKPAARVEADGSFRVTTYDAHDGAPPGDYVVTVTWGAPPSPDQLGGKFRDPAKSELKASVNEGDNVLEPFELSLVKQPSGRNRDSRPAGQR